MMIMSNDESSQTLITSSQDNIYSSSGFQNPRIVKVSQAFGGKDRHSKVWTVKGVRDRRIRLSIPTAIELYHLQEQLGLNQPSKVIDWLLHVAKDDIDQLPPLQMAPEYFNRITTNYPHIFSSTQVSFSPVCTNPNTYDDHHHQRMEGKEAIFQNKWNSCDYEESYHQPFSNLSLSRSDQKIDSSNYTSVFPSSSAAPPPLEPQISATPSFFPPYCVQLLSSSSPFLQTNSLVPVSLNLIDTQVKAPFGLNMN